MACRIFLLALFAAAATVGSGVADAACNPDAHAENIIEDCSPGVLPSQQCCTSLFAALPSGGLGCLCDVVADMFTISAGLSTNDFVEWYASCGGSGDELAATCARDSNPTPPTATPPPAAPSPPVAPSPPAAPVAPPPPPPAPWTYPRSKPEAPWYKDVAIAAVVCATFLIFVCGLFACHRWCKGPTRDLAASTLNRVVCAGITAVGGQDSHIESHDGTELTTIAMRPRAATVWPCGAGDGNHTGEASHVDNKNPSKRLPIARPSIGREGKLMWLHTNHFAVRLRGVDSCFYKYSISIKSKDGAVNGNIVGRKVIDKLLQSYSSELRAIGFAYDGEKSLFTLGSLPKDKLEFIVSLEETPSRVRPGNGYCHSDQSRIRSQVINEFVVDISYVAKIPVNSVDFPLGSGSEDTRSALSILNLVLRQQQAKRGCLVFGPSFSSDGSQSIVDLSGGISGCRGLHSSFCSTIGGLSLNIDVSTCLILTPGSVIDFLIANQNVSLVKDIDWPKAEKMLKNLRVKARHNNMEFKILGLSDQPCLKQMFPLKVQNGNSELEEVTVERYFQRKNVKITMPYLPCLDVGQPGHPNYLPVELSDLVSPQRYTKELSAQQRETLVEISRQKPQERMRVVTDARKNIRYVDDQILFSVGIEIDKNLTTVASRVLSLPMLVVGNSERCIPYRGRWNYNNKKLLEPTKIEHWAIVNFSAHCDMRKVSKELINCGKSKGIFIEHPYALLDEDMEAIRCSPVERVERMFKKIRVNSPDPPKFLLCALPERKNCDIYGPWKKKNLHEMGIVTQCIAPGPKMNDKYLNNLLLKINAKLGGKNSQLAVEESMIPAVTQIPTLILGMDVSHGSPGGSGVPSIAAVVGSRYWPSISQYGASVRIQSPKTELIDSLFKIVDDRNDDGMIRELLLDFHQTSQKEPSQIIIFRDGVSESQFSQVLNFELNQIIKAYQKMGWSERPKFTVIIAQKNHNTKFFQADSHENIPPGTVVETNIVHPRHYDFYMCAHAGATGTSRPIHYHVLLDEIGFSADDLQKLVLSLSYVYQRSTSAVSVVAPIKYAHLAAAQIGKIVNSKELAETSSRSRVHFSSDLTRLHPNVCRSMFFC